MRLKSVKTLWNLGGSELTQHALSNEKRCAHCGKVFLCTSEHVYQRKEGNVTLWYCSYTCWRVKQKEDEARAKEEFERSLVMLERKAQRDGEYAARKREKEKSGNYEQVICKTLAEAKTRLEEAEQKILEYGTVYIKAEPGSYDRTLARRNMRRWERKRKYLREEIEYFEQKEREDA